MFSNRKTFLFTFIFFFITLFSVESTDRLTSYSSPKKVFSKSEISDWPRFNGPMDNASSPEACSLENWNQSSPEVLWEILKGEGYASPAITNNILVLFHRKDGFEQIEGLHAESGKIIWTHKYEVEYRDRYGYSNGPRASPVIENNLVYSLGVTSWLTCLNLKTGKLIWNRDLKSEFKIPDYFFGKGANPIVYKNKLIVNVGGSNNRCVVAFNTYNGRTEWICDDPWGASYSSPTLTSINGKTVCLVLTGGESRPPTGGLLVIDPENGKKLSRFSWRSSQYESANAVPPIPCGENQVFLSECYEKGGVLLEFDKHFKPMIVWENSEINIHWMTPIIDEGVMFGIAGRHQQGAETFALNLKNGKSYWKERIMWDHSFNNKMVRLGLFRGSILKVGNGYIGLSELGSLLSMRLSKEGWSIIGKKQLFFAPGTWTLPALSNGLLYVMQNETDRTSRKKPRMLCINLRQS